jgi:high-affinity nickel permease
MSQIVRAVRDVFSDRAGNFRRKVIGLYLCLIALNIAAWMWAVIAFAGNLVLLGSAVLAYTFGLRHAFDADHIAAIDTTTRKLMQRDVRPTTVGFHFAIGHSLALFVFVAAIAAWGAWGGVDGRFNFINSSAGLASTFVSASFLLVMAALNLTIAERQRCDELYGMGTTSAPQMDRISASKRAVIDQQAAQEQVAQKYRDSMPGGSDVVPELGQPRVGHAPGAQ